MTKTQHFKKENITKTKKENYIILKKPIQNINK